MVFEPLMREKNPRYGKAQVLRYVQGCDTGERDTNTSFVSIDKYIYTYTHTSYMGEGKPWQKVTKLADT